MTVEAWSPGSSVFQRRVHGVGCCLLSECPVIIEPTRASVVKCLPDDGAGVSELPPSGGVVGENCDVSEKTIAPRQ